MKPAAFLLLGALLALLACSIERQSTLQRLTLERDADVSLAARQSYRQGLDIGYDACKRGYTIEAARELPVKRGGVR
jgi:hypothetical protein